LNEDDEFIDNAMQNKYIENRNTQNYVIEKIEVSAKKILKENYKDDINESIKSKIHSKLPGDTYRQLAISNKYTNIDSSKLDFKQIWIAAFCYDGYHTFRYICDSENADNIKLIGEKPEDEERKKEIKILRIPFILMIIFTGIGLISFTLYSILKEIEINDILSIPLIGKILFIFTILSGILSLVFGISFKRKRDAIFYVSKVVRSIGSNDD
jgi:hypothetical protein